jgi:hypothetical protein
MKAADIASQAIRRSRRSRAGIVLNIIPLFSDDHIYLLDVSGPFDMVRKTS